MPMFLLGVALQVAAATAPTPYQVLRAEHGRGADMATLRAALASSDTLVQRLAARAIGRIENPAHGAMLRPVFTATAPAVRAAAITAAAQLKDVRDVAALLDGERDVTVREAIYAALGRAGAIDSAPGASTIESLLVRGLQEPLPASRGAARGLESWARRTARNRPLRAASLGTLRDVIVATGDRDTRMALMLALLASGARDTVVTSEPVRVVLRDPDPQLRRLGVMVGRQWIDDPSPIVRWQALRTAGNCERAIAHLRDTSEHVALLAIDILGEQRCDAAPLRAHLRASRSWRVQARGAMALARLKTPDATDVTRRIATSPVWQARAWAAQAARALSDSATLRMLARDTAPNVALAALHREEDALRALQARHAGLVLTAAEFLKGSPRLRQHRPAMIAAFARITAFGITWRDPRAALMTRLDESAQLTDTAWFGQRLSDADPSIASHAARVLTRLTGRSVAPSTTALPLPPFPTESAWQRLRNATLEVRFKHRGIVTVALLADDAPATVHQVAQLAASGRYVRNTIHRIVPNFVIQGGSPGADEYDPVTSHFMRDEVGGSHVRGTFGISTRGRDTGDGQLFVNLVDNWRLDHDYTVIGATLRGLDIIDAIEEGDVITSVRVVYRSAGGRSRS